MVLNLLGILFGTSMLVPGLLPGLVIGVVLAANGCVLMYLLRILISLDRMRAGHGGGRVSGWMTSVTQVANLGYGCAADTPH